MTLSPNGPLTQVMLAEYSALRAEIASRISAQDTMINLYMTGTAAIVGVALTDRAKMLLLILPALSFAVRLLYHNHNLYIGLISSYLNNKLRPLVVQTLDERNVLGWEKWCDENVKARRWLRLPQRSSFCAVSSAAALGLVLIFPALGSRWHWLAWIVGWGLLLAQVVLVHSRRSRIRI
jgi:hypothetical protein